MQSPLLAQRGRATIDFQAGIGKATGQLHQTMELEMARRGLNAETLPADIDAAHDLVDEKLSDFEPYRVRQLLGEWASKNHGTNLSRN
jgi:hypothetical protein